MPARPSLNGTWQEICIRKQAERQSRIPPEWIIPSNKLPGREVRNVIDFPLKSGLMTELELEITEKNACELVKDIASGSYTSVEVVTAFCHRAALAQQLVNW
jgi:amidase